MCCAMALGVKYLVRTWDIIGDLLTWDRMFSALYWGLSLRSVIDSHAGVVFPYSTYFLVF